MTEQEKYDKALQDLMQAKRSFLELTEQQKRLFVSEVAKAEGMEQLIKAIIQQSHIFM